MWSGVNKNTYKTAIVEASIGTFISLVFLALLTSGSIFYKFFPIWITIGFAIVSFLIEKLPIGNKNKHLKGVLKIGCGVAVGILITLI